MRIDKLIRTLPPLSADDGSGFLAVDGLTSGADMLVSGVIIKDSLRPKANTIVTLPADAGSVEFFNFNASGTLPTSEKVTVRTLFRSPIEQDVYKYMLDVVSKKSGYFVWLLDESGVISAGGPLSQTSPCY